MSGSRVERGRRGKTNDQAGSCLSGQVETGRHDLQSLFSADVRPIAAGYLHRRTVSALAKLRENVRRVRKTTEAARWGSIWRTKAVGSMRSLYCSLLDAASVAESSDREVFASGAHDRLWPFSKIVNSLATIA